MYIQRNQSKNSKTGKVYTKGKSFICNGIIFFWRI